jgi:hypothetical protein
MQRFPRVSLQQSFLMSNKRIHKRLNSRRAASGILRASRLRITCAEMLGIGSDDRASLV